MTDEIKSVGDISATPRGIDQKSSDEKQQNPIVPVAGTETTGETPDAKNGTNNPNNIDIKWIRDKAAEDD